MTKVKAAVAKFVICIASSVAATASPAWPEPYSHEWQRRYTAGVNSLIAKDYDDAKIQFQQALDIAAPYGESDPLYIQALNKLAQANFDAGDTQKAINICQRVVEISLKERRVSRGEAISAIVMMARAYSAGGQIEKFDVCSRYAISIVRDENDSTAEMDSVDVSQCAAGMNRLSSIYFEKKQWAKAEAIDNEAIRLEPNEPIYYNNRSCARQEQQNYKGAEEDAAEANKLGFKPPDVAPVFNLQTPPQRHSIFKWKKSTP